MSNVFVIGGAALETCGFPTDICRMRDSNPGYVRSYVGGVGRNVAKYLVRLGEEVQFITAIGNDATGNVIKSNCEDHRIHLDYTLFDSGNSATILGIYDEDYDLLTGICEMSIMKKLTPAYFEPLLSSVNASDFCVIDSNISSESIDYLACNLKTKLYYEPVSIGKARNIVNSIHQCYAIKANRFEAALISGCSCDTVKGVYRAAEWFLNEGVEKVLITLGPEGVVYADRDSFGQIEGEPVRVKDSRGAGDCMSAAIIHAMLGGKSLEECARQGNHAGAQYCAKRHADLEKLEKNGDD